jgi:site-specific DNA-methyltransferase (adenine-specific)
MTPLSTIRERLSAYRTERIGDCLLVQGDCLEVLPLLEGGFDAICADPPYNITGLGGGGLGKAKMYSDKKIAKWCDFNVCDFLDVIRGATDNVFCFCSRIGVGKYLSHAIQNNINYDIFVWHKPNAIPFTNATMKQDFEYIVRLYTEKGKITKGLDQHKYSKLFVSNIDSSFDKEHPTKKPIQIMKRLVELCSKKGGTVLDPYMGSGTTGVACVQLGRAFIGVEIEPKYFDIAVKRIREAYAQPDIFIEAKRTAPVQQDMLGGA